MTPGEKLAAWVLAMSGWSWVTGWPWYLDLAVLVFIGYCVWDFDQYCKTHPEEPTR